MEAHENHTIFEKMQNVDVSVKNTLTSQNTYGKEYSH